MRLARSLWRAFTLVWLGRPGVLTIDAPPTSLSAAERDWLKARAEQAGGFTEAFVCLVRLNILTDAWIACCDESRAVRMIAGGSSRRQVRRCLRNMARRRAVTSLMKRVLCAMTWARPAPSPQAGPYDDPALPLPHSLTRRLIIEGRFVCEQSNDAVERPRAGRWRNTPLLGLSRAEAAWLARKARALGGLDAALCSLVRNGFDHERIGHALRAELTRRRRAPHEDDPPH